MIDSYISSLLTTFIAKRAADDRHIQDTMNQPQMAEAIKDVPAGTYPPGSWPRGTEVVYDPRTAISVGGAENLQNQQGIQMRRDGSFINPLESTAWRPPALGDTGGLFGNAAVAGVTYGGIKALQNWRTLRKPYSNWTPAERQTYVQGTVENLAKGKDAPIATAVNTTPKGVVTQLPAFPMTPSAKPSKTGTPPGTPPTTSTPPAAAAGILDSMRRAGVPAGGTDISVTGAPQTPGKFFGFQRSPSPATSSTKLTRGPAWFNALRPGVTSRGAGGNRWGAAAAALAPTLIGGTMAMLGRDGLGNPVDTNPDGGYLGVLPRSNSPVGTAMVPALRVRIPDHAADAANAQAVTPTFQ